MGFRKIKYGTSFKKSYDKYTKYNSALKKSVDETISELENDSDSSWLRVHKLSGNLYGLFACSCGYDCRIVFSIERIQQEEIIVLMDVGTHNDVY